MEEIYEGSVPDGIQIFPFGLMCCVTPSGDVYIPDNRGRPRGSHQEDLMERFYERGQKMKWKRTPTFLRTRDGEPMVHLYEKKPGFGRVTGNVRRSVPVLELIAHVHTGGDYVVRGPREVAMRKPGHPTPDLSPDCFEIVKHVAFNEGPFNKDHPLLEVESPESLVCRYRMERPVFFPVDPLTGNTLRDIKCDFKEHATLIHYLERARLGCWDKESLSHKHRKLCEAASRFFENGKTGQGGPEFDDVLSA